MSIKKRYPILLAILGVSIYLLSWKGLRAKDPQPKREYRGVWIATINNIDWPPVHSSTEKQKESFIKMLDELQELGVNMVIVQVRPAADAFYNSNLEPWSQWLTGKQGEAPTPYYDPLAFMVEEAHARCMEFHAWVNPFRAVQSNYSSDIHRHHITKKEPLWFFNYGNSKFFDPGHPDAREFIVDVITDIAIRYDIDGLHFDDYYYPYPDHGRDLPDKHTYYRFRGEFKDIRAWRRDNVNKLIKEVSESIKEVNPKIKFGVSPFGVWRNRSMSAVGSATRSGYTCYDHLYADVRLWMKEGWVDYVAPQLYQNTKHKNLPYKTLVDWWGDNSFGRHIMIGHAVYRLYNDKASSWNSRKEMPYQIRFARSRNAVQGSILYSWSSLKKNKGGFKDSLGYNLYTQPAIPPTMPWKDAVAPSAPRDFTVAPHRYGTFLKWASGAAASDGDTASYYLVYRFRLDEEVDLSKAGHIISKVPGYKNQHLHVHKREGVDSIYYQYVVTAMDKLHNESKPGVPPIDAAPGDEPFSDKYPYTRAEANYFFNLFVESMDRYFNREIEE